MIGSNPRLPRGGRRGACGPHPVRPGHRDRRGVVGLWPVREHQHAVGVSPRVDLCVGRGGHKPHREGSEHEREGAYHVPHIKSAVYPAGVISANRDSRSTCEGPPLSCRPEYRVQAGRSLARRGFAPDPRRHSRGPFAPLRSGEARRARLWLHGASPRTPAGALWGPRTPHAREARRARPLLRAVAGQHLPDHGLALRKQRVDLGRLASSGFGEIGPATPLASDDRRDRAHHPSGVHPAGQIPGD